MRTKVAILFALLATALCYACVANAQSTQPKVIEGVEEKKDRVTATDGKHLIVPLTVEKENLDVLDLQERKLVTIAVLDDSPMTGKFLIEVTPVKPQKTVLLPAGMCFKPPDAKYQNLVTIRNIKIQQLNKPVKVWIMCCCCNKDKAFANPKQQRYTCCRLPAGCPILGYCQKCAMKNIQYDVVQKKIWTISQGANTLQWSTLK